MTASSRLLARLLFPLLSLSSLPLLADTVEGAPQALHLLDYISADYPPTVAAGKVIDDGEYREQLEFTRVLQGLITALPAKPEKAALEQGVESLHAAITAKQDGADVARQARQLGAKLAVAYEVSQAPIITPDPTRGAPLYAQNCSVCHGDTGAGDGPAGLGLTPAPANLRDAARMDHLSLYAIYSTLGQGVEGTDMPAFADQLDDRQRWDLATYIAGFSADAAAAKSDKVYNIADPPGRPRPRCRLPRAQRSRQRSGLSARNHRRSNAGRHSCLITPPPRWTRASRPTAPGNMIRPMTCR